MPISILAVLMTFKVQAGQQKETADSPAVEDHIQQIIKELPSDSFLRRNLFQGARGDGVHHSWMDNMRKQGIKRAVVWVNIDFDSKGRPKTVDVNRTEYFERYENGVRISDTQRLEAIRTSGLEKELTSIALDEARHGYWVDVPRPKPRPFIGSTKVEFFDDEWLPTPSVMFIAKR
jgi:hypothetical protein